MDGLGVVDLVAGAYGNLLSRVVAAGGDINQVDAGLLQKFGECDGLRKIPARAERLGSPVGSGDTNEDREVLGPSSAERADDLEGETDAIVEASAVLVGALVRKRREEFVEEVAMGGVDFNEIEAGGLGTMCGCNEVGSDLVHACAIQRCGDGVGLVEADGRGGDGLPATFRGRDGTDFLPWNSHAGFAASMGELCACVGAVLVEKGGDALEFRDVLVLPDTEVAGGDASFGADGVGFCDNQAGAANRAAAEVDQVPVIRKAVYGGVFAHGGDGDAVWESEAAKLERGEEVVRWLGHIPLDVAEEIWTGEFNLQVAF